MLFNVGDRLIRFFVCPNGIFRVCSADGNAVVRAPDVLGIDVVWSGLLDDALLDLKPFLGSELSGAAPDLVSAYTVNGRVVAVPYHPHVGVLYYRTDLLKKYGYQIPPQ